MNVNGRTVWWAKDAGWWRRERIVELGEEFGPVGPAVIDWLACEAKAQNAGGVVKTGYHAIARGVFADVSTVRPVVSRSVPLGLLDDFVEADRVFTCRISGWTAEQARARETVKKAGQRASQPNGPDDPPANAGTPSEGPNGTPPPCPALSPVVPESPPTGQDRRVKSKPPHPPRGERPASLTDLEEDGDPGAVVPRPPASRRAREVQRFEEQVRAYAAARFPELPEPDRSQLVGHALGRGAASHDAIEHFIRQWTTSPDGHDGGDNSELTDEQRAHIAELGAQAVAINAERAA